MSAAAVTPNVRGIVVCDEVFGSEVEANVYNLEGVRQLIVAPSFPVRLDIHLFLQFECARAGTYSGTVRLLASATDREIRRFRIAVEIDPNEPYIGYDANLTGCLFRGPGRYDVEVWFKDSTGREVQKGFRTFEVPEQGDES